MPNVTTATSPAATSAGMTRSSLGDQECWCDQDPCWCVAEQEFRAKRDKELDEQAKRLDARLDEMEREVLGG